MPRRAQEVTVRIRSLGCERFGLGSGFLLPGGIVVTNRHVIDQPRQVTVSTWDGVTIPAEVSGVAVDSDLALLRLATDVDLPEAELRTTPVEIGEPADVIRVDAEKRQGNSGGPLLDEEGRVIGVVFALKTTTDHGLAVPIETLLERLDATTLVPPTGDCWTRPAGRTS